MVIEIGYTEVSYNDTDGVTFALFTSEGALITPTTETTIAMINDTTKLTTHASDSTIFMTGIIEITSFQPLITSEYTWSTTQIFSNLYRIYDSGVTISTQFTVSTIDNYTRFARDLFVSNSTPTDTSAGQYFRVVQNSSDATGPATYIDVGAATQFIVRSEGCAVDVFDMYVQFSKFIDSYADTSENITEYLNAIQLVLTGTSTTESTANDNDNQYLVNGYLQAYTSDSSSE